MHSALCLAAWRSAQKSPAGPGVGCCRVCLWTASVAAAAFAAVAATVALAASRIGAAASVFFAENEFAQHVNKAGGDNEADDDLLCHPKILDAI